MRRMISALLGLALCLLPVSAWAQDSTIGSFTPGATTSISVTNTSSNVSLAGQGPTAFLYNSGSNTAYVAVGAASTTTATTSGFPVLPGMAIAVSIPQPGYVAAITASSTTTLSVTQGWGGPNVAFGNVTTTPAPSPASTAGTTPVSTAALAANLVVKASAGNLYGFEVSADSTLSAAAWWIMVYNLTAAPVDGAVTPTKCYAMASGTTSAAFAFPTPDYFSTGITIGVSTTGCFTKTASTHAFISGDAQ